MAIECLEFSPIEAAVTEEEEMATKAGFDGKWWVTTGLVIIGLVGGAAWRLEYEFSALDKHISRVETAVRIIGAKQGGDTSTLVDESLKVALNDSNAGRIDGAKAVVTIANNLLKQQRREHVPAQQETFDNTLIRYQQLKQFPLLRDSAHDGLTELADYRSALTEPPPRLPPGYVGNLSSRNGRIQVKDALISGDHFLKNSPEGLSLDGLTLENVVFMDVDVYYHGGTISMNNVKFVNCRFHVPNSDSGDTLLEAAIEAETQIKIG